MLRDPFIGFVGFMGAYLIARIISERGNKMLSPEEKGRLVEAFAGLRVYGIAVPFAALLVFFRVAPESSNLVLFGVLGVFLIMILVRTIFTVRTLKRMDVPAAYVTNFLCALIVQYFGLAFLFIPVIVRLRT